MNRLSKIGYSLLALIILIPILNAIFTFFDIQSSSYLPYLAWMIAVVLFFALLPSRVGNMFE